MLRSTIIIQCTLIKHNFDINCLQKRKTFSMNASVIKCRRQIFHYAIYKSFRIRRHISCIQVGNECFFTCNEAFRHIKSFRDSSLSYLRMERKLNYFTTESASPSCRRSVCSPLHSAYYAHNKME